MDEQSFKNDEILSVQKKENIWIIEPHVRLDLSYSENFFHKVMEILHSEPSHLLIDMMQVPYISSSGIKILLKIKNFLEIRGYKFALINLTKEVNKIIHISELHHLLPIFYTENEAITFIKK
jgi:anti-anti-sigma factor